MKDLRISIIQFNIAWKEVENNLKHCESLICSLQGKTDLVVLPEMFATGFSVDAVHLAETNTSNTIQQVSRWAREFKFAVCGSFLAKDYSGAIFNRGFFITPESDSYFYDKRHLFRMGKENDFLTIGNKTVIIPYNGWNIRMIICYDLRFPVWIRNKENEYDLLICVANWPENRASVWETLLKARALENQCYVCGVNRIGTDKNKISYKGDSILIDYKGNTILEATPHKETTLTGSINKNVLDEFREKFPVWMDADSFEIK